MLAIQYKRLKQMRCHYHNYHDNNNYDNGNDYSFMISAKILE